jgi:predicted GNAT family acetyltransferase
MTKSPKKKIYGLKGYLSTLLETMGCKLLGRSDGKKRILHYGSFLIKNG